MLTKPRWEAEILFMSDTFPTFEPFALAGEEAGFVGWITGPRTGVIYKVRVKAVIALYPEYEPGVYMEPHPESHHWILDNRLCYRRERRMWNPAKDTFAQVVAMAAKYIAEFDGA